jgi:raffinose/stachyose/melibiose transport system substrate-binding protein
MKVMMVTGALLLVLAVGCGRKAEETPDVRKLTFWHIMNYAGPREILADAARRFEADHPGCLVEIQTFENDDYKTKLAVELASGTPPDILFTWGGGPLAEYAKAGKVMDLTDALRTNDW